MGREQMMTMVRIILFVAIWASFLGFAVSHCNNNNVSHMVEEISVYHKKEIVNGMTFVIREDTINGVCTCQWTINGQATNESEYITQLLDAERAESQRARVRNEQRRIMEREARSQDILSAYKKIVRTKIAEINQWLQKIEEHGLNQYLVFGEHHYPNRQLFDALKTQLLPEAEYYASGDHTIDHIDEYRELLAKLDDVPGRLTDLYYATIHNAITVCNDTKMLKELLEMVSQA